MRWFGVIAIDSRAEEVEKGDRAREFEVIIRRSHGNGRPKGNEVGVNRSKYGLIMFVYLENDKANFVF